MNKPADDVFGSDAKVLRVRGALAFTDATRPGAGALADAAILIRDRKIAGVGAAADPATADPRALEVGGDRYWIIPGLRQNVRTRWRSEVNSNCRYRFLNNRSATFEGDLPLVAMNDIATDVAAAIR